MLRVMLLYGLNSFANGGILLALSLIITLARAKSGFGFGPRGAGVVFAWFGAASFLVQLFVFRRFAAKLSSKRLYLVGGGLLCFSCILLPWAAGFVSDYVMWTALLLDMIMLGAGFMGALPTVNAILANATDPRMRGFTQGAAASIGALLRGSAPLLCGILFAASISRDAPYVVFLFLGAVYMICLAIALSLPEKDVIHEGELKLAQEMQLQEMAKAASSEQVKPKEEV